MGPITLSKGVLHSTTEGTVLINHHCSAFQCVTCLIEKINQLSLNKKSSEGEIHCILNGLRQMKGPVATVVPQCRYLHNKDADLNDGQSGVWGVLNVCPFFSSITAQARKHKNKINTVPFRKPRLSSFVFGLQCVCRVREVEIKDVHEGDIPCQISSSTKVFTTLLKRH